MQPTYCDIPADPSLRRTLRAEATRFMKEKRLTPPLSVAQLRALAKEFMSRRDLSVGVEDWIIVQLNNALWIDLVAAVPYERRILLLPQCLRNSRSCRASFDEWGLLCAGCRGCSIDSIQAEADRLGMITLISEGYSGVEKLLQSGEAEAVIGVACLESLEKSYSQLIGKAVAAVAVPLNESNCIDTTFDMNHALEFMRMSGSLNEEGVNFEQLHTEIKELFTHSSLTKVVGEPYSESLRIAYEYVCRNGNRWRPLLAASVYSTLVGSQQLPDDVIRLLVAIEFFHKASLVHDDIEDNDAERDGIPALHTGYGLPMAVNIGDLLLAEGYRLLAECNHPEAMRLATQAVVSLCIGQGKELEWNRSPKPLSMDEVIDIFKQKTSPAFTIALRLGAIFAGASAETVAQLCSYAEALGVAYQLKDDLSDSPDEWLFVAKPHSLFAALCESHPEMGRTLINKPQNADRLRLKSFIEMGQNQVSALLDQYREAAYDSLLSMSHSELKRLLFRLVQQVLGQPMNTPSEKEPSV